MEYRRCGSRDVSVLVLGTVQIGVDYGVANRTGKPDDRTVIQMLDAAFEAGVTAIDTAALYGDAEERLGRALSELGVLSKAFIVSKARPQSELPGAPGEQISTRVEGSLRRLGVDHIPVYLLHGIEAIPHLEVLVRHRERGDLGAVGVSVYTAEEALQAIAAAEVQAVQCPVSILDQRFLRSGVAERAAEAGVAIFARSVYLQGVVTMEPQELPDAMSAAIEPLAAVKRLAPVLSREEVALRFVASLPGITGVVVGMETAEQVERNVAAVNDGPLDAELVARIKAVVPDLPDEVINASLWAWMRDYDWSGQR